MKVAVISNQLSQTGKSSLAVLLASTFARTQRKRVMLFSTESMVSLLNQVTYSDRGNKTRSVQVYKALLETASINNDEILDYALRIGEEEVYAFDIFSSVMDRKDAEELFLSTVGKVNTELIIVEICGSIWDMFNQKVIQSCDAILNVFNPNMTSINAVRSYMETYDRNCVARTGYICQRYDANALSEKRIAAALGKDIRNIVVIPYNPAVMKCGFEGNLDTLAKLIAGMHSEVTNLVYEIEETMQYLFDSGKYKYIKDHTKWYR